MSSGASARPRRRLTGMSTRRQPGILACFARWWPCLCYIISRSNPSAICWRRSSIFSRCWPTSTLAVGGRTPLSPSASRSSSIASSSNCSTCRCRPEFYLSRIRAMDGVNGILHGLQIAALPVNLLHTLIGVFIGTMISHLPGIGPSAGIALLIPVTFGTDPTAALIMLAGIYYGCMYGGAVTAILLNTPGDAAALMTVLDGYPMARKGRAGAALAIAATSSFIAGTLGVTALTFLAAPLASFALKFGPPEFFALMLFALTTVSALTGDSLAKGLISTFTGLGLATIGIDLQTGAPRFTFGLPELFDGISFLVVVVGIFAIAEVSRMVEGTMQGTLETVRIKGRIWFTREEFSRPARRSFVDRRSASSAAPRRVSAERSRLCSPISPKKRFPGGRMNSVKALSRAWRRPKRPSMRIHAAPSCIFLHSAFPA